MWTKKGLIFSPAGTSSSMVSHAAIPFADQHDPTTLRIYFSSRNEKGQSLPYFLDVNRDNPKEIKTIATAPILSLGALGTFDDSGIMPSCIVNFEGRKYMYYIAWNPQVTVSYRLSIGLAISTDGGNTYSKYSIAPVCDRSLEEPYFNTAPFVFIENGTWRMWYISCTGWEMIDNYPEPRYHVKYAESQDGIHWIKKGIVCIDYDQDAEAIGRPSVFKEGDIYKMYYSYRKVTGYRSKTDQGYRLGYAESADGLVWTKKNDHTGIACSPDQSDWDHSMIEYCHVIQDGTKKYMFYNGNGFGKSGFGYAES